jgi:hypothetical protein
MILRLRQLCVHHYLVTKNMDLLGKLNKTEEDIAEMIDRLDPNDLVRVERCLEDDGLADCTICLDA